MARDRYTAIRIERSVNDEMRRLVRQLAASADRDVTLSDALAAATGYALDHLADVAERLPSESPRESGTTEANSEPRRPPGAATESETPR